MDNALLFWATLSGLISVICVLWAMIGFWLITRRDHIVKRRLTITGKLLMLFFGFFGTTTMMVFIRDSVGLAPEIIYYVRLLQNITLLVFAISTVFITAWIDKAKA